MTGPTHQELELSDLQGGVLSAYGKLGYPIGRYILFHVDKAANGRKFVEALRAHVTTARRWKRAKDKLVEPKNMQQRPACTLNIAFTFWGLAALGVSTRTLRGMPDEFIDGMAKRARVLGDDIGANCEANWDDVWRTGDEKKRVHILVMLNAQSDDQGRPLPELDSRTGLVLEAAQSCGVKLLEGHRGPDPRWQDLTAIFMPHEGKRVPTRFEHFGFADAIGDPVFEGQYPGGEERERCVGQGAVDGRGKWRPLAPGEFILGWPDEAQEVAGAAMPLDFSRNGTFFAYRKLHEDVEAWDRWIATAAAQMGALWEIANPADAADLLMAKMAGRWPDGVPLVLAPTPAERDAFNAKYRPGSPEWIAAIVNFTYAVDPRGERCPFGSHLRRANPRDMLDPRGDLPDTKKHGGSVLNNRRRILRRGLPYGHKDSKEKEHGIVFLAHCASLFRQFEFVQQQWMNYGLDFEAGNQTCPIIGPHGADARFVVPSADPGKPPFVAAGLRQFVSTRGGDYFFTPSMTALRMIGQGTVDPT